MLKSPVKNTFLGRMPRFKMAKEHLYKVHGMHCKSCEILIEKKIGELQSIKSVRASMPDGKVTLSYEGDRPSPQRLSNMFREENYTFSDFNLPERGVKEADNSQPKKANSTLVAFNITAFIVIVFLLMDKAGVSNFLNLNTTSSILAFFGFGLLAGLSSCAALVGGIVLSMSRQWNQLYTGASSAKQKLQPHIMFNAGRVISYTILGGVLGAIGSGLQLSAQFTAYLIVIISLLMVAFGLQMLGVKAFRKFQISAPKFLAKGIANESNFQGKYMPFIMGALTFFLPCGFTITAQGVALLSKSAIWGGLITGAFALGTAPVLLIIGLSSVKFYSKPNLALTFSKVAGFLVLFFAIFNISNQMNVLGFTGIDGLIWQMQSNASKAVSEKDLAKIVGGKQVIKMTAYGNKDVPNYFKVKAGVPVRWEIAADKTAGGCNASIISNALFAGAIPLTPGQISVKEFTPQKPGKYRFSCQMGMITGIIEVIN